MRPRNGYDILICIPVGNGGKPLAPDVGKVFLLRRNLLPYKDVMTVRDAKPESATWETHTIEVSLHQASWLVWVSRRA